MHTPPASCRTRRRPLRCGVALVVASLVAAACGGGGDGGGDGTEAAEATTTSRPTTTVAPTTTTPPPVAPLTGEVLADDALRNRPAMVVKVDNTPKAVGKQEGIDTADLVFAERVEGGSVRLAVSLSPQALGQFEQLFPTSEVRSH